MNANCNPTETASATPSDEPDHTASADRLLTAMCLMVAVTIIASIICL